MAKKVSPDDHEWIFEKQACEMLGFKDPRTLRGNAKDGKIPVNFTTTNGRRFKYSLQDLKQYQLQQSTAA